MIKEFTTTVSDKKLTVKCDEKMTSQAELLLRTVKQIGESNGGFNRDENIRIGWTVFTVKNNGDDLTLYEPDFFNDPVNGLNEDVTKSLTVLAQHNFVTEKLGVKETPVLYSDKVVYAKGVLDEEKIYLQRSEVSKGDSGWYVGSVEDESSEPELEAVYVYQLLQRRPEIMSTLTLPEGYLAIFTGNHIDAIVNEENQNIWN